MFDFIRKWMIRRWYKLDAINKEWWDKQVELIDKGDFYTKEWAYAYGKHRTALDKRNGWRNLMRRFGWVDLTWNNYYGSPNRDYNPVLLVEQRRKNLDSK